MRLLLIRELETIWIFCLISAAVKKTTISAFLECVWQPVPAGRDRIAEWPLSGHSPWPVGLSYVWWQNTWYSLKQNMAESTHAESTHRGVNKLALKANTAIKAWVAYYFWCLCTLYLHTCLVRVTPGDSGLCCCVCFECYLTPLWADSTRYVYTHILHAFFNTSWVAS